MQGEIYVLKILFVPIVPNQISPTRVGGARKKEIRFILVNIMFPQSSTVYNDG